MVEFRKNDVPMVSTLKTPRLCAIASNEPYNVSSNMKTSTADLSELHAVKPTKSASYIHFFGYCYKQSNKNKFEYHRRGREKARKIFLRKKKKEKNVYLPAKNTVEIS